ncbi:hypothetical protein [Palleronia sp.]|uniref:hypothetical protein n=1 Tax=Palleronia sp. TaxID=1940284 RepID=UPI0035C7ED84
MSRASKKLIDLLDTERKALLSGDLAAAIALAERKEVLAAKLETETPDADDVRAVQSRAKRNAELLAAALKGAQAAREKITFILAAKPFTTYGSDGRSMSLGQSGGGFERRA